MTQEGQNQRIQQVVLRAGMLGALYGLMGCTLGDVTEQARESTLTCKPGVVSSVVFRDGAGETATTLGTLSVFDQLSSEVSVAALDDCGQFVDNVEPESWSLSSSSPGFLTHQTGPSAQFQWNRGQVVVGEGVLLSAARSGMSVEIPVETRWSITETPQLLRWFRADQYMQSPEDTLIGTNGSTALKDFSLGTSFDGVVTNAGREPRLKGSLFSRPVLQFCGLSAGCTGVTMNSHLRTGSSFNQYAATDFTLFYVVARNSTAAQYFLVNQSSGNNTGLFLGYTNNTTLRLGLAGPGGSPQISATVDGFSGTPTLEILTARLDTSAGSGNPGLRLYRNGVLVASNDAILSQQAAATTIPLIGSQRSDQNSANFYFGETATYTRALSESEMCRIHRYLDQKYALGLNFSCTP